MFIFNIAGVLIMAQNRLYDFILGQRLTDTVYNPIPDSILASDVNRKQQDYFRCELNIKNGSMYFGFQMSEHHLSIYKNVFDESQYHYTAHFSDKQGIYQLHVFFNEKDQPLSVSFKKREADEDGVVFLEFKPERDLSQEWTQLAIRTCTPVINILRAELNKELMQLEREFQKLELNVDRLSEDFKTNRNEYNQSVEQLYAVLEKLHALTNQDHYTGMSKMLRGTQQYFEMQYLQTINPCVGIYAAAEPHSCSVAVDTSTQHIMQILEPAQSKKITKFYAAVQDIKTQFETCSTGGHTEDVYFITKIYEELKRLEDCADSAPSDLCAEFHGIKHKIYKAGKRALYEAVQGQQLEKAKVLVPFHHLLNNVHFIHALETKNASVLDFLLAYGSYLLNNQPMIIGGRPYLSAVDYCYKNSETMADCFKILLKHNALITSAANDELPIAHKIIQAPDCALFKVVEQSKLLSQKEFYQNLASSLNCYLAQNPGLDAVEKKGVKKAMNSYRAAITQLESRNMMFATSEGREKLASLQKEMEASPAKGTIIQLQADPEISKLLKETGRLQKELFKKFTPIERKEYRGALNHSTDWITKQMDILTIVDVKKHKSNVLEALLENRCYLLDHLRLKEIQITLKTKGGRNKELNKEQQVLVEKINSYAKKIKSVTSYDMSDDFATSSVITSLKNFRKELGNLASVLQEFSDIIDSYKFLGKPEFEESTGKDAELENVCRKMDALLGLGETEEKPRCDAAAAGGVNITLLSDDEALVGPKP